MTSREKLLAKLSEPRGDEEIAHAEAEDELVNYLRSIGDNELADKWEAARYAQNWWYS